MLTPDVVKKIKEVEIHTRRALNGTQVGGHIIPRKGSGFEFDQIRSYEYGDDFRFVDCSSSARTGKLMVRQYFEERNRTILVCVDVSASTLFSSGSDFKSDTMQKIAAVFTLVAEHSQDNVGLILFSDTIEKVIPPSRGKNHTMRMMDAIFSHKAASKKTDLNVVFQYLVEQFKKEAVAFIVSDFIADGFEKTLQQATCKREIVAVRCLDKHETKIPNAGYVWAQDSESGVMALIDMSKKSAQDIGVCLQDRINQQNNVLRKYRVDVLDLIPDREFVQDIILFFRKRMTSQ